eukprot:4659678-Amphidinium_carterae.1
MKLACLLIVYLSQQGVGALFQSSMGWLKVLVSKNEADVYVGKESPGVHGAHGNAKTVAGTKKNLLKSFVIIPFL